MMSQMVQAHDVRSEPELGLTLGDLYRLSVEQYEQMARHGILKSGDPIELLGGLLVLKRFDFDAYPETPDGDVPIPSLYRLSVEQYERMARLGILKDGEPVELLDGLLVTKMTKNPPHTVVTLLTRTALERLLPAGWFVSSQEPVQVGQSEPEPDLLVVRGHIRDYIRRHPQPQDVALVIEVADATLRRDRVTKKRDYARAGIPVYWLINLRASLIEVYTDPSGPTEKPTYRQRQDYGLDDAVGVVIEGREVGSVAVSELLP